VKPLRKVLPFLFLLFASIPTFSQWIQSNTGITDSHIYALAAYPNGAGGINLFAATGSAGIFLSTDEGKSWTAVNAGLKEPVPGWFNPVYCLAFSPASGGPGTNLYAGTGAGIFRSTDNGTSWIDAQGGIPYNIYPNVIAVSPSGSLFAGTPFDGVYRSTDNGASWIQVNTGLSNTKVKALAISPDGTGGTNLFAGTYGGGIFLSTNNGTSWSTVNTGMTEITVNVLAVCGTTIIAGTNGYFTNTGIFRSTNNGSTWSEAASGFFTDVRSLAVLRDDVIAGTFGVIGGVGLSSDRGINWNAGNAGLPANWANIAALAIVPDKYIFAGSETFSVWKRPYLEMITMKPISPSEGATLVPINTYLIWDAIKAASSYGLQVSTVSDFSSTVVNQSGIVSTSYALLGLVNSTTYYWRVHATNSTGTSSWSATQSFTTIVAIPDMPMLSLPTNGAADVPTSLTLSWNAVSRAVSYQLQVSINSSFSNYVVKPSGLTSTSYDISGLANNTTYYWRVNATNAGGNSEWSATRSFSTVGTPPDPGSTSWVNIGLNNNLVKALAVSPTRNIFSGTDSGVFRSTNNGANWMKTALTNRFVDAFVVSPAGNIFAGTEGDGIFLSTNDGSSWSAVNVGLSYTYVYALAVASNGAGGTNLFAGTSGNCVFLSTDNGANWNEASAGLSTSGNVTSVRALAVCPVSGGLGTNLFAGTEGNGIFLSTDNGTNWSAASTGLTNMYIRAIAVSPNGASGTNLFAGTWGGIFLSTDDGANWAPTNSGLSPLSQNVFSLAVSPNGAGGANLFAGTFGGVYLSTHNGTTWTAVNTGWPSPYVWNLVLSPDGGGGVNLFAGTYDGGVWRRLLSGMVSSVDKLSIDMPTQLSIEQNYPNPFNPTTTIKFQIPTTGFVSLKVYNMLGGEVAELVNGEMKPGSYSYEWNASNVSSGVYFCRLQAYNRMETRKLILLK
jgi:hypothetical protein